MTKIIVAGALGRMGKTILSLAQQDSQIKIAGAFERPDNPFLGKDVGELAGGRAIHVPVHPDLRECIESGDVLIDFTQPAATLQHLKIAVEHRRRMVIGTTGLAPDMIRKVREAAKKIAIVQAPNMSLGVNLLFRLARLVGSTLSDEYDVEITEAHHKHKKDAPSGTALELAREVAAGRKIQLDSNAVYGRKGITGARKKGSIGIHAIRGGDVVGDHTVSFLADGERVELTHRASSREAFARGALLAAKFLMKKKNGFYTMQQVLGLD